MKVKISHEVPFCLLKESLKFNDYQYALPHLLKSNETYKNHFLECKQRGVEIYMDNSLHELGYSLNDSDLLFWLKELEPSNFFVPDVWEDHKKTIKNVERWSEMPINPKTQKIAIVQAKSLNEAKICLSKYVALGYKKFAFSYGASYYNEVCPHPNKDLGKAIGRFIVVKTLFETGYLNSQNGHKIHLLGCSVPLEFGFYKNIPIVESIDTSNPIMATLDFTSYKGSFGLESKPKSNMNNNSNISIDEIDIFLLYHNINQFKKINNLWDGKN